MPVLGKSTLSRYLRSDCDRQLRLLLHPETGSSPERVALGMPLKQRPRPGLQDIAQAGHEWAAKCLEEVDNLIGPSTLIGRRQAPKNPSIGLEFNPTPLADGLRTATPDTFLAEHEFNIGAAFTAAHDPNNVLANNPAGNGPLTYSELRPDLIEVLVAGSAAQEVSPEGGLVDVAAGDTRLPLRVIDIKLTSEPGPGYFAEVVYYSIALAGWLKDHGWDSNFFVASTPALWPGSHQASALWAASEESKRTGVALTAHQAVAAIYADLVEAPFSVFASRIHHFFTDILPGVLAETWQDLPYHVSPKCKGCDFLGDDRGPTNQGQPDHCMPLAATTEHLSRIPFISRGATGLLDQSGVKKVSDVASTPPADTVYDQHHSLRAQRTVINARAASLSTGNAGLAPMSGTSAMLPRGSDLNIYVSADFDASSAITFSFGVAGFWSRSRYATGADPEAPTNKVWKRSGIPVTQKNLRTEEQALIAFLNEIWKMIDYVRRDDTARNSTARNQSSVQVYMWDELTYRHLCRVVGRHLDAILQHSQGLRLLAWLFPPEEVLPNARLLGEPVITIVSDAVKSLITLPTPHFYSLLGTARLFHTTMDAPFDEFRMPGLYEDALSDQIPSERAHDMWKGPGTHYTSTVSNLEWAVRTRLQALEEVTKRLRGDLRGQLRRYAPKQGMLAPINNPGRMTADELLLLAFTKLNAAADAQEKARLHAMPPHEREARFASLRMTKRLTGQDRTDALAAIGYVGNANQFVYRIRPASDQANFKEGDFLCALVPEARLDVLTQRVGRFAERETNGAVPATVFGDDAHAPMLGVLAATLVRFDRHQGIAVVEPSPRLGLVRNELETRGLIDLSQHVSLEKVSQDFFSKKLEDTLRAIGKTPKALASPIASRALGLTPNPRTTARVPVEDLIWDAHAMSQVAVTRNTAAARTALEGYGRGLNDPQWAAFEHALTHRLSLIWGPPGTGKSRTVTNIVLGAAHDALLAQRRLRILVTSFTYNAVDNVLNEVGAEAKKNFPQVEVWRARSSAREPAVAPVLDCMVEWQPVGPQATLNQRLTANSANVTVLGASPQQLFRLASAAGGPTEPLFDLIVVDEASQTDVANALLPLAALAEGGSVVVAGDPLQLPPIQQVTPPVGTEHLVGSIYDFLSKHHQVPDQQLLINYRSNAEIVGLGRDADYPAALTAHSPRLSINLLTPLPATQPTNWPTNLVWSPDLNRLLDPARPVSCVVYKDGLSGQSNQFEAQVVASLAWLLDQRLADQLDNERDPQNNVTPSSITPYSTDVLFEKGLGVVTPHRAQQSMVSSLLTRTFPGTDKMLIRSAVDTVERFQGQQRDVIIASYAVGDPDTVAQEDEFLQSLNRFNVMVSRARAKIIVLMSEELVQHLPQDIDVLRASRLLKAFADLRCNQRQPISLPYLDEHGAAKTMDRMTMRWV